MHNKINREQYWNQRSKTYLEEIEETFGEANDKIIKQIKKYCNEKDIVLDIGCGPGVITKDIASSVKKIKAIDISPEMINKARKNNLANVDWEVNELLNLKIEEEYTFVTACNVLLYMENVGDIMNKIYDILPMNGYLVAVIDCLGEKKNLKYISRVIKIKTGKRPYNKNYSIEEFKGLFTSKGFEIVYEENLFEPTNNYLVVARKMK